MPELGRVGNEVQAPRVEMGLHLARVPHRAGGVAAAMDVLAGRRAEAEQGRARLRA